MINHGELRADLDLPFDDDSGYDQTVALRFTVDIPRNAVMAHAVIGQARSAFKGMKLTGR